MPESYDTVAARAQDEFTERRSRFIGAVAPAENEEEARAFIADRRSLHRDAGHNCYAYVLREGGVLRYSDDGEPKGTAGLPILEVVRREGLFDVAVVVTRYFGGILLGAGGLTRAYAHGAKLAVDSAKRVTMCPCSLFMLETPYPFYERVQLLLQKHGAVILDTDFGAGVTFRARMRTGAAAGFQKELAELSGGALAPMEIGEEFAPI